MAYLVAALVFLGQEVLGLVVFPALNWFLGPSGNGSWRLNAAVKGTLERLVLYTALIHNYPQMLIAFGALKLGTRLHDEENIELSNSYFLAGNLLSIFLAMCASVITKELW